MEFVIGTFFVCVLTFSPAFLKRVPLEPRQTPILITSVVIFLKVKFRGLEFACCDSVRGGL